MAAARLPPSLSGKTVTRKTPPPPLDLAAVAPELAGRARTTVRLHPRRGDAPPNRSKIGSPILWPASEAWPQCAEHGSPLIPVLQLLAADVPELLFPANNDLFQLLWCPNDHPTVEPLYYPTPRLFWRNSAKIDDVLAAPPAPANADKNYSPDPCVLHFERVLEYPDVSEVSKEFIERMNDSQDVRDAIQGNDEDDAFSGVYQFSLSVASGWKVGGFPHWVQDPYVPTCACGDQMEYLLTIASAEFDGGTWHRWLAEEERNVWGGPYKARWAVQCAPDIMLGDMGSMNVFICRKCDGWPTESVCQCC